MAAYGDYSLPLLRWMVVERRKLTTTKPKSNKRSITAWLRALDKKTGADSFKQHSGAHGWAPHELRGLLRLPHDRPPSVELVRFLDMLTRLCRCTKNPAYFHHGADIWQFLCNLLQQTQLYPYCLQQLLPAAPAPLPRHQLVAFDQYEVKRMVGRNLQHQAHLLRPYATATMKVTLYVNAGWEDEWLLHNGEVPDVHNSLALFQAYKLMKQNNVVPTAETKAIRPSPWVEVPTHTYEVLQTVDLTKMATYRVDDAEITARIGNHRQLLAGADSWGVVIYGRNWASGPMDSAGRAEMHLELQGCTWNALAKKFACVGYYRQNRDSFELFAERVWKGRLHQSMQSPAMHAIIRCLGLEYCL